MSRTDVEGLKREDYPCRLVFLHTTVAPYPGGQPRLRPLFTRTLQSDPRSKLRLTLQIHIMLVGQTQQIIPLVRLYRLDLLPFRILKDQLDPGSRLRTRHLTMPPRWDQWGFDVGGQCAMQDTRYPPPGRLDGSAGGTHRW